MIKIKEGNLEDHPSGGEGEVLEISQTLTFRTNLRKNNGGGVGPGCGSERKHSHVGLWDL